MDTTTATTARQLKDVKNDLTKAGDLGLLAAQCKGKQSVLCKPKPLTVHAVYQGFKAIAAEKGNKSMDKKVCPHVPGVQHRSMHRCVCAMTLWQHVMLCRSSP